MSPSTPEPLFPDGIDDLVASVQSQYSIPSQCIGIVDGTQTATRAYGHAQLPNTPATEDTLYYIASCTKSFTATTLQSLLSDLKGTVTLQSTLESILPAGDFALAESTYATSRATLEDALAHRLGTARHDLSYGGRADYSVRDVVRSLRHLAPAVAFREKYHYLNQGYMTVQHAVETLAGGEPIEALHKRYIWEPSGMRSTFISLAAAREAAVSRLAVGYTRSAVDPEKVIVAPYVDDYPLVGGGGIISSIADMTRYMAAVVHNGFPALAAEAYEDLFVPRVVAGESPHQAWSTELYALGWKVATFHGHRVVYHDGGICGFAAKMLFLPAQKWGVVVLANSDAGGSAANETVLLRLLRERLGLGEGEEGVEIFARWENEFGDILRRAETARERLYPPASRSTTALSLPLDAYEGLYDNAGYGRMRLRRTHETDNVPCREKVASVLHAEWPGRLMDFVFDFEHVGGEEFVVWVDTATSSAMIRSGQRGRFVVRDGSVDMMGVNLSPFGEDNDNGSLMIWFRRVGE